MWEGFVSNSKFIVGDNLTMADVFFFPHLAVLVRGGFSFKARPRLEQYYEKLSERPSIQASWPPYFKESPPTEIFSQF